MKLSIVIPSYCSQDYLKKSLAALAPQVNEVEAEVIVVDCSPNDEVDKVCKSYDFVRIIRVSERFNPGKGRNIGAKEASGDYLVFIDSDVVIESNGLKRIQQHALDNYLVFGGALELDKKRSSPTLASFMEHYYFNHESQASRETSVRANLSSALMIIQKNLFLEFGGFKDIPRMQDTELTERLIQHGYTLYFFPDIIGHQIQDSTHTQVLKKIFITGNNVYFIRYNQINNQCKKILLSIMLPLMMAAKVTRINIRNLRYSWSIKMLLIFCPLMYVCGIAWMSGFYKALFFSKGIISGR